MVIPVKDLTLDVWLDIQIFIRIILFSIFCGVVVLLLAWQALDQRQVTPLSRVYHAAVMSVSALSKHLFVIVYVIRSKFIHKIVRIHVRRRVFVYLFFDELFLFFTLILRQYMCFM